MKDLVEFLKDTHNATLQLLAVPIVAWTKGDTLKQSLELWYVNSIEKKFL